VRLCLHIGHACITIVIASWKLIVTMISGSLAGKLCGMRSSWNAMGL